MPKQKSSVEVFKALAQELGIKALADMHAEAVRHRDPPPRLVARIFREEKTILTPKQREIMVLLASGYRRQEIADELGVMMETVKSHLKTAYERLGAHNQIEAINAFLDEAA
jgi:DNA-binding NarL/FixJ family response regulator